MIDSRHRSDVSKGGRNGGLDNAHAYNGTSMTAYYLTPAEFFHPGEVARDPADTARDTVGVLDQHGSVSTRRDKKCQVQSEYISILNKVFAILCKLSTVLCMKADQTARLIAPGKRHIVS